MAYNQLGVSQAVKTRKGLSWASFTLFLGLLSPISAQNFQSGPGSVEIERFGGLNDTDAPAVIPNNQGQDMLNVEANLTGTAILKRKGFTQEGTLTITTAPVNGSHNFTDPNGNLVTIVCNDHYCAKAANGGAFTNFISTAGGAQTPKLWQFRDINGKVYGVNDVPDQPFQYDGTTLIQPLSTSVPQGSLIELTKDRMVISGVTANPNRVYYSRSGLYTDFTVGPNSADPWTDDFGTPGDKVTALKYELGRLFVFKRSSIMACVLQDQYYTTCLPISNVIGTQDPSSLVTASDGVYFRSQDRSYWRLNDSGINLISKEISSLAKNQTSGSNQSNIQTSQTDWNAGNQAPTGSWNTSTIAGSVFPSSNTFIDTFNVGTLVNVSTTDSPGKVTLSSNTIQDNFASGSYTTPLNFTPTAGNWGVQALGIGQALQNQPTVPGNLADVISSTQIALSSGSWKFTHSIVYQAGYTGSCDVALGGSCFQYRFMKNAGGDYYFAELKGNPGGGHSCFNSGNFCVARIGKNVAGTSTILTATNVGTYDVSNNGAGGAWEVQKTTDGRFYLYINSVFIASTAVADVSITSATQLEIAASGLAGGSLRQNFTNLYSYQYVSSGTYYSPIFDTTFTTPTTGAFSSTFTAPSGEASVFFYVHQTTSPNNDMWGAYQATSDTLKLGLTQRYWQYAANVITQISTKTPNISAATLPAASTGTFATQCISPPSSISSWGILSCDATLSGGGSIVYYATSAATCAGLPTTVPTSWQTPAAAVTNNSVLTIATNTALSIGFRSLLTSTTDQAQINACTVYWTNGTAAPPVWGLYDSIKNAVYWTTAINNSSTNNRVLKYDLNLNQWFPFDIQANALKFINSQFYFGDPAAGRWYKYAAAGVDSDNGAAINAYWKSKDFAGLSPYQESNWKTISAILRNQGSGSVTETWATSLGQGGAYTVSLSTVSGINYVRSNHALPNVSGAQFLNVRYGNNAIGPFELDGLNLGYITQPWKAQNP